MIDYQTNQESARPQFILTHYTDLVETKGVVLMVGEGSSELSSLKLADAQNLVYQTQLFYLTGSEEQKALVELFWKNPQTFDYKILIDAMSKLA